jgi:hypothetical protein
LAVRDFLANLLEHHVQRWIRHTLSVPDLMAFALNLTPFGNNDFKLIDHALLRAFRSPAAQKTVL